MRNSNQAKRAEASVKCRFQCINVIESIFGCLASFLYNKKKKGLDDKIILKLDLWMGRRGDEVVMEKERCGVQWVAWNVHSKYYKIFFKILKKEKCCHWLIYSWDFLIFPCDPFPTAYTNSLKVCFWYFTSWSLLEAAPSKQDFYFQKFMKQRI